MGGAAGCILGLLKLHRATNDDYALDRAVTCGHHLLRSQAKDDNTRLWRHLAKKPLPPSTVTPGVRLPQYVDAVVLKALEKLPDKRHQTIEKFSRDFRNAMAG